MVHAVCDHMKPLLPNIGLLFPVINIFRKAFSKPQFKQFERYIGGLILLANKTVDGMTAAAVEKFDQSSLNRFLTESPWETLKLELRYFSKLRHVFGRNLVSLIIDDSLAKKTGKHIADVQFHKSHTDQGYVFGHQFVTALLKAKNICFPLFPKLYSKRTCSKIEFAIQLIEHAAKHFRLKEVILDSWYMATDVIKCALRHKLRVIGCLKSNRKVSIERGEWLKLSALNKSLRKKDFSTIIVDDATYQVYEKIVRLKHVGFIKLLISRQWMESEKKWSRPFYLISTDVKLPAATILRIYADRWSIETFHRDVKQHLGLEDCQFRTRKGIIRHLMLATLAYAVLKLWMHLKGVSHTIGEAIRWLQVRLFDDLIITLVEETDLEKRRLLAQPFISRTAKAQLTTMFIKLVLYF